MLRIGTRSSPLAFAQTKLVTDALLHHGAASADEIELVPIRTIGDKIPATDFFEFGGKSVFTRELDTALLEDSIDLAVHSIKDLPATLEQGVRLSVVLPREDACDGLITRQNVKLDDLADGTSIGTVSVRRSAQLLHRRPNLKILPLRGNVATRLSAVESGKLDATLLAVAGLKRLGLFDKITEVIPLSTMLSPAGQGAIGITIAENRTDLLERLAPLNHLQSQIEITAERSFMRFIGGNCRMPLGAHATCADGQISIECEILSPDGTEKVNAQATGDIEHAEEVGVGAGMRLQSQCSVRILTELRNHRH